MSGIILQNYSCHSSEDVIAALRNYNLNPLKHSFRTDSPSRPFETIGTVKKSNSKLLFNNNSNSMGKTAKPRALININSSDISNHNSIKGFSLVHETNKASGDKPGALTNIGKNTSRCFSVVDDPAEVRRDSSLTGALINNKNPTCFSIVDDTSEAIEDGENNCEIHEDHLKNHKEYLPPVRGPFCEIRNTQNDIEEMENQEYGVDLKVEDCERKYSDVGVQATAYHCNDCRRHLKYNQQYKRLTMAPYCRKEPEWAKFEYGRIMASTRELITDSEAEIHTLTEEELERRTVLKEYLDNDQRFKQEIVDSVQSNYDQGKCSKNSEYRDFMKEKWEKVPDFERPITATCSVQTDFTENEPKSKQLTLFEKISASKEMVVFKKTVTKFSIVFLILGLLLLAWVTMMGSDVTNPFNLNIILKYLNLLEEPKNQKGYFDWTVPDTATIWQFYCDSSWTLSGLLKRIF